MADDHLDAQLARYAESVRACPHNLLSPRGLAELETRHIPETLAFARRLPTGDQVLDVGPGAGLPGMVIALARPDLAVTMVEATRKKARFLQETAERLQVSVTVHHGRVEELGPQPAFAGRFDLVTARAVAPLTRLVPWVLPTMRVGGQLWAIKGETWREELAAARETISQLGAEVVATPADAAGDTSPTLDPSVVIIGRARATRRGDA